jgi:hypothetical protein
MEEKDFDFKKLAEQQHLLILDQQEEIKRLKRLLAKKSDQLSRNNYLRKRKK